MKPTLSSTGAGFAAERWFCGRRTVTGPKQAGAVILLSALTVACSRSPYAFARAVSHLSLPDTAEVLSFQDESSGFLAQDLHARAEFRLSPRAFQRLMAEAASAGYVALRPGGGVEPDLANQYGMSEHGFAEARNAVSPGAEGLFFYSRDTPSSYSLVVLVPAQRRVVVEVLIV